jgi:hypothetical protein
VTPYEEVVSEYEQDVQDLRDGWRDACRLFFGRIVPCLAVMAIIAYVCGLIESIR